MPEIPGTPIHIEAASSDASSGVNLIPFEPASVSTLSLTGRVLALTDLTIISKAGGTCTLQSKLAGVGTITLFGGVLAANGGVSRPFRTPAMGIRGGSLVLTADAGQIHIQAEGVIVY